MEPIEETEELDDQEVRRLLDEYLAQKQWEYDMIYDRDFFNYRGRVGGDEVGYG